MARSSSVEPEFILDEQLTRCPPSPVSIKKISDHVPVFFENGWTTSPLYHVTKLAMGNVVDGPAIILDNTQTIVVAPRSKVTILERHVMIELDRTTLLSCTDVAAPRTVDPVELSVMAHRFMSIAEQMGLALQKTSVSVNIKERLDFTCALFSPEGRLVANAPHVPVHVGSMEQAVMYQHRKYLAGYDRATSSSITTPSPVVRIFPI
jgi:5-oxoprolinase (ATP-hydrolysing)